MDRRIFLKTTGVGVTSMMLLGSEALTQAAVQQQLNIIF